LENEEVSADIPIAAHAPNKQISSLDKVVLLYRLPDGKNLRIAARIVTMVRAITNDLAYAARALRKTPGFALAAIGLLAVGVGGTTVVFSLADVLLFRPLDLPRPAELVRVVSMLPGRPPVSYYPYSYFEEWRARTRSLSGTFAEADVDTSLTEGGASRLVRTGIVSADYFTVLRATPAVGRPARPGR
jgi:hypothetical protein